MNIFLLKLAVAVIPLAFLIVAVVASPCLSRRCNRVARRCRCRRRAMLHALAHGIMGR